MRRMIVLWTLLAAVFAATACAPGRGNPAVDAIFADWDRPDSPGMAVAVIDGGETVFARGYGMADLEHGIPVSPESRFYIGSTSKQFVAMSIMLLEQEGKLSLDDDVHEYVPGLPDYGDAITIRHLLTHTSGLKDYLGLWVENGGTWFDAMPPEEVMAMVCAETELNHAPGDKYQYTNTGYLLLAEIVKRVSGDPLSVYARENIFEPLGMTSSHFHDDRTRLIPNRAHGHLRRADGSIGRYTSAFDLVGSGGLYTTVGDLAKWDANYYDNRLPGGDAVIRRMSAPTTLNDGTTTDYGYGLMTGEYRGLRKISHSGTFVGYRAELLRFPGQRFSVIVLSNLIDVDSPALARKVADAYLGEAMAPEKE